MTMIKEKNMDVVGKHFHLHFEGLQRYAFTLLKNNDEAKDAVQSVFMRLLENPHRLDKERSIQAYLYQSVYHHCLNVLRHRKVRDAYEQNTVFPTAFQEDTIYSSEVKKQIEEALDSLPPQCRTIFYKSRFDGMKYAAIAREMNLSVKTVEAQMGKALKILRVKLKSILL
ncbi:MAG: RNA polymerase sigma-70 factor [Chitinophagaceae bacterium]